MPPKPRNLHIPSTASPAALLSSVKKAIPPANAAAAAKHLTSTSGNASPTPSSANAPVPAMTQAPIAGPSRTWRPPKPHLAHFASSAAARNPSAEAYQYNSAGTTSYSGTSSPSGSSSNSRSPTGQPSAPRAPQLPKRRQPAFNPGGFGMQSAPPPAPGPRSGLAFGQTSAERQKQQREQEERERAQSAVLKEVERRTEEIRREEMAMEGRVQKEGEEEAEACYVVCHSFLTRTHRGRSLSTVWGEGEGEMCKLSISPHLLHSTSTRTPLSPSSTRPTRCQTIRSHTKHGARSTPTPPTPSSCTPACPPRRTLHRGATTFHHPPRPKLAGGKTLSGRAKRSIRTASTSFAPTPSAGVLGPRAPVAPCREASRTCAGRRASPC
jgi:hypothetical protein